MFAFHLFNTVTNHTVVATHLLKMYRNEKVSIPTHHASHPALIVFIL